MTGLELRPYQGNIVNDVRVEMKAGHRSILVQLPTGAGKTAIATEMLGTAESRGMAGLFLVHRRELVRQTIKAFAKVGLRYGVIASGYLENRQPLVQLGSINTYARRMSRFKTPTLVAWDEAHHVAAAGWSAIKAAMPNAYHVGFTATPERLDGTGLGEFVTSMVQGPSTSRLIADKFLSPFQLYRAPGIDVAGVHTVRGDYVKSELSAAADRPTITGDAIREYRRYSAGKRAVVFCVSIEHSKHVAAQFNAAGITAEHVDGETPIAERDAILDRFERGDTLVVCNVELFGEGFDLPALECVICLRPTQSLALWLQMCGRALRISEGKDYAVILDHAGNRERHGRPDDDRTWSLEGRIKSVRDSVGGTRLKTCPQCRAPQPSGFVKCTNCGYVDVQSYNEQLQFVQGDLVEDDPTALRISRAREQAAAGSLGELVELGRSRGYKGYQQWAENVYAARLRRDRAGSNGL